MNKATPHSSAVSLWRRFKAGAVAFTLLASSVALAPAHASSNDRLNGAEVAVLKQLRRYIMLRIKGNQHKSETWAKCFRSQSSPRLRSGTVEKAGQARLAISELPEGLSEREQKICLEARHWGFNKLVPDFLKMRLYLALSDPFEKSLIRRTYDANGEEDIKAQPYLYVNPTPDHLFSEFASLESRLTGHTLSVRVVAPLSQVEVEKAQELYLKEFDELIGKKLKEDRDENSFANDAIFDDATRSPEEKKRDRDIVNAQYRSQLKEKMAAVREPLLNVLHQRYVDLVQSSTAAVFLQVPEDQADNPEEGDVRAYEADIRRGLLQIAGLNQKVLNRIQDEDVRDSRNLLRLVDYGPTVTDFIATSEEKTKGTRAKLLGRLKDVWKSQKTREGAWLIVRDVAIGMGCFFIGMRAVNRVAAVFSHALRQIAQAGGLVFCSIVSGVALNYSYLHHSNDEYMRLYEDFFSAPGRDGALRDLANLEDADAMIFMDSLFLFVGMGFGEALEHVMKNGKLPAKVLNVYKNLSPGAVQ